MEGFFTRGDVKDALRKRTQRRREVSKETLHQLGVRGVRTMNPNAKHPNMPATGSKRPLVLILGEAPGENEDIENRQFVGKAGTYLRSVLPPWIRGEGSGQKERVRYNNVVGTRPVDAKLQNRAPTDVEIECFRPSVIEDIEKTKPNLILALGGTALKWGLGHGYSMTAARGRRFPLQFGKHACWFYTTFHPSFINRIERGSFKKVPGHEWKKWFEEDVARACREAEDLPPVVIEDPSEENLLKGIEYPRGKAAIRKALTRFKDDIAFDIETYPARPYAADAELLSFAVSDGDRTIAFEWDGEIRDVLRSFFQGRRKHVAHEIAFEQEWLVAYLGRDILDPVEKWGCTMNDAYVIDQRAGGKSLEFLCLQEFGLPIKQLSPDADRKDLRPLAKPKLLRYNALDAKYTAKLYHRLMPRVEEMGLEGVYDMQIRRVPAFVCAQADGLPLDRDENERLDSEFAERLDDVATRLKQVPEIKVYERKYGTFNPNSEKDLKVLFVDLLKLGDKCFNKKGNRSYDESVLKELDVESAGVILEHRKWAKLRSTYVTPFEHDAKDSLVWPDGKLHCSFSASIVETGRSQSDSPNMQNWAKRKKEARAVRKQIRAPRGHRIVSIDQGQIEARALAMHSCDEVFCQSLWDDYDVHFGWAEHIAKAYPPKMEEYADVPKKKRMKAFRSEVKNQFVFPAFYLAGPSSLSRYLGIPEEIIRHEIFPPFWEMFAGIKAWQNRQIEFYEKHRYVECLTKRRRWGPLSSSMIVNTPPQGTASDITIESFASLSLKSRELDMPWLQPVSLVHDDCIFIVPNEKLEEMIEIAVEDMLKIRWSWINVPLSVEVMWGENWYDMEEIGTFRSDQI